MGDFFSYAEYASIRMKKALDTIIRIIFLFQMGFLIYSFLGIAVLSMISGDIFAEWIFYLDVGILLLVVGLYIAFRTDLTKLSTLILYGFSDLLTIGTSIIWAYATFGTLYVFQTIYAIFSILTSGFSIVSFFIPKFRSIFKQGFISRTHRKKVDISIFTISLLLVGNTIPTFFGYNHTVVLEPNTNNIKVSYWGSSWNASTYDYEALHQLEIYNSSLYLFIPSTIVTDNPVAFNQSLTIFANFSIELYLTTGIPDNKSYFQEKMLEIAEFVAVNNFENVIGFTADVEWSHSSIEAFKDNMEELDFIGLAHDMFQLTYTRAEYEADLAVYQATIDGLHALGFEVHFVGMMWELDDRWDGDISIERLVQMASRPEMYDIVNYMLYRYDNAIRDSPYWLYYYINQMAQRFSIEDTSVSLGVTGYYPLDDIEDIILDIKVCQYMGVPEAVLFIMSDSLFPSCYNMTYEEAFQAIDDAIHDISEPVEFKYTRSLFIENMFWKWVDLMI